jgi:beta-barrel assembly-enhancing protease
MSLSERLRRGLLLVVLLGLALPPWPAARAADDLPDIGSPADSMLSREEELQLGRAIYRSMLDTERVITDPEIDEYLQDVGRKIGAQVPDDRFQFRFFIVDDPAINAFALPGGYIGVHSGLLLASASESELAGVLAHEVSHVTQRHISRAVYANSRMNILTMAAMLGAILLGAAGAGGDVVQGTILSAQGLAAQQQINFTRSNEYEADRVGVGLLYNAGFDPYGMPSFFETLARQTGPLASQAPEFLRTHPVTVNRIAETRARAANYPRRDVADSIGYGLARARARVLTSPTPEKALAFFTGEQQDPARAGQLGTLYGLALAHLQLGRATEAQRQLAALRDQYPNVIAFHSGLAQAQFAAGDRDAGLATFRSAMALFPRNVPLSVRYAEALMANGDHKQAHRLLLDLFNIVPPTSEQVRIIALAASGAGDTADAHYYMAEYHLIKGDPAMAADQLRLALSIPGLDNVQRARFQSRLQQVNEWLLASRNGRPPPPDQEEPSGQRRDPRDGGTQPRPRG